MTKIPCGGFELNNSLKVDGKSLGTSFGGGLTDYTDSDRWGISNGYVWRSEDINISDYAVNDIIPILQRPGYANLGGLYVYLFGAPNNYDGLFPETHVHRTTAHSYIVMRGWRYNTSTGEWYDTTEDLTLPQKDATEFNASDMNFVSPVVITGSQVFDFVGVWKKDKAPASYVGKISEPGFYLVKKGEVPYGWKIGYRNIKLLTYSGISEKSLSTMKLELIQEKSSAITDSNKSSTTNYPSNKAVSDFIDSRVSTNTLTLNDATDASTQYKLKLQTGSDGKLSLIVTNSDGSKELLKVTGDAT